MSNRMTCRKLVQNGAEPIFDDSKRKADALKCLSALVLHNEAEGSRTLNLRIDSLSEAFVSTCGKTINDCQIRTYDAGRCAPEAT